MRSERTALEARGQRRSPTRAGGKVNTLAWSSCGLAMALAMLAACSPDQLPAGEHEGAAKNLAGNGGSAGSSLPSGGSPAASAGSSSLPSNGGAPTNVPPTGGAGQPYGAAGQLGTLPSAGGMSAGGASSAGVSGGAGAVGVAGAGGAAHVVDHCLYGYDPEPTDDTMAYGPAEFLPPGVTDRNQVDLILQPEVLDWFHAHNWEDVHVEWHAIRTCGLPAKGNGTHVDICRFTQLIPTDQNCQTSGDGYQFLLAHRHMITFLKELWPKHADDFKGFDHFPQSADDVPEQWRSAWKPWSATTLANGQLADNIDKPENLSKFPDEGSLGFWLQCLAGQTLPNRSDTVASGGIHFDLHGQWVRTNNSTHALNNGDANVDNYMFYKIHGWIDQVWAKYRKAKGLSDDDPKFKADLVAQCREMDAEEQISLQDLDPSMVRDPNAPLPVESGFFHEQVRPIFESATNRCSGCHSETGPSGGMTLGGHISSKDIVAGLVGVQALDGGQYQLVVPGDPDHSWLYLKPSGLAASAGCMETSTGTCITAVMPPDGGGQKTVSDAELAILRQWILDGAQGPPSSTL